MKAQLLSREMLEQHPANAKPKRITTGENHSRSTSRELNSQSLNRQLRLIGVEEFSALRQLGMQPAWRSNQSRPLNQQTLIQSQASSAGSGRTPSTRHHSKSSTSAK